jgi:glycosyltransferase involved in cell wall biosynthesis
MKLEVLVGIPCFNEEATVGEITRSILSENSSEFSFRVIVVNDGSTDNTVRNALVAGAEVITHKSNRGLGSAFETFREFALKQDEDIFVVIDGDGQFPPSQILSLLPTLIEGKADVVLGSRFTKGRPKTQPFQNYFGNLLASHIVSRVTRSRFTDVSCGFRAYSRKSLSLLRNLQPFNFSQHTLLQATKLGLVVKEIPIVVNYSLSRKTRMATSFSSQSLLIARSVFSSIRELYPLRFYSYLSLLFFLPSAGFGVVFVLHFLRTGKFTGYLFAGLLSAFLLLIGLLLILVGLISESLGEIRKDQSRIIARLDNNNGFSDQ